jgi:hypothetical protein
MSKMSFHFRGARGFIPALMAALALSLVFAAQPASAQNIETCYTNVYEQQSGGFFGFGGLSFVRVARNYDPDCNYVGDDRINQDNYSAAAIYCRPDGIAIWDLDDLSRGTFAFLVTYDAIESIPDNLLQNTLIVEDGGFRLYKLTSNELQLNGPPDWEGKEYVFTWAGCERPAQ